MKKIISLLIMVLVLFACKDEKKPKVENASYQMKNFGKIYAKYNQPYDIKVDINYPEIKDAPAPAVLKSINDSIASCILGPVGEDKVFVSAEELFTDLTKMYEEQKKEFPDYILSWDLERKVEVVYNAKKIFTFRFLEYSFLGGAHPNTTNLFTNFDLSSGNELKLSDLFVNGFEEKLRTIAEEIFRKDKELTPDADLEEAGFWFKDGKFELNNNFYVSYDGIGFYYNPYEIAAYVYGPTDLLIPYAKIKDLLKLKELIPAEDEEE